MIIKNRDNIVREKCKNKKVNKDINKAKIEITNYSEIITDHFSQINSSLSSFINMNRNYIQFEINENYFSVALNKLL